MSEEILMTRYRLRLTADCAALLISMAAIAIGSAPAQSQQLPPNYIDRVGGVTNEVCVTPTVTAGLYDAGNSVGGLITLPGAFLSANTGMLQSIRLTFKSVQTAEFDVTFFSALPATAFADHAAPAIAAADATRVQPTIKLINNFSGLGTHTVYGSDSINRRVEEVGSSLYAVITTPGTPTFASTSDVQLCASISQD
jgi:hypothetical protein